MILRSKSMNILLVRDVASLGLKCIREQITTVGDHEHLSLAIGWGNQSMLFKLLNSMRVFGSKTGIVGLIDHNRAAGSHKFSTRLPHDHYYPIGRRRRH